MKHGEPPDVRSAATVLERAARGRATIQVAALSGATMWHGVLAGVDEAGLTVESAGSEPGGRAEEGPLTARLVLDGRCFAFDTERLDRDSTPPGSIRLRRPAAVRECERRRARRTGLVPSASVSLRAADGGGWRASGSILNLSEHGLAVGVDAASGGAIRRDGKVRLMFQPSTASESFELDARVASLISTGQQRVVVGLEFELNERFAGQWERLRTVLMAPFEPQPVGA